MIDKDTNELINHSRRKFFSTAGAGAALTAGATLAVGSSIISPQAHAAENSNKFSDVDYDVIVIGGGNAGAAATRDSSENGYNTLLLEARNRLGGRTFTTEFAGHHVEMGGTWIHHTQPFVWAEAQRYNLEIEETPGGVSEKYYMLIDGKVRALTMEEIGSCVAGWHLYTARGREILPRAYDILHNKAAALKIDAIPALSHLNSIKSQLNDIQYQFVKNFTGAMAHNKASEISYLEILRWSMLPGGDFSFMMDAVARFKLKDGTISLINAMLKDASKAQVKMSTVVSKVEDLGDKVKVTTTKGEVFTCKSVINCLPMNVIGKIDFSPALPAGVIEAGKIKHTGIGHKIYMKVKGKLGKITSIAHDHSSMGYLFTYKEAEDHTLLVGFGIPNDNFDPNDDEDIQRELAAMVPGAVLESSFSYDWLLDPHSAGTYCSYKPGWVKKYYDVFQKDYGNIFFGSSDHGEGWRGFIDGAIGGGIKAAQRVKAHLS